ncbi:MAG: hypothetical protein IJ197_08980 [Bacteroidaceae bacterium]|nr:hypothetical protein [Bacteroidaceae bacterium]
MTLRLTLISPEVEDFILELKIDADASFADLHRLILKHCGFEEVPGQRFFVCDDSWKPIQRILLGDEEKVDIDEDVFLMDDTDLGEFIEDEGQRLTYRFDPENRRMFLLELTETTFGDPVPEAGVLTRRHGNPPAQFIAEEEPVTGIQTVVSEELEEEFYGEDGFEEEDLDLEGFDILE